jgi:PAS domain S-box-containing protein
VKIFHQDGLHPREIRESKHDDERAAAEGLPMTRTFNRWLIMGMIVILAGGIVLTSWMAQNEAGRLREDTLLKGRLVKEGFSVGQIERLTGSEADLTSQNYIAVKEELIRVRSADPFIRFIYFMGQHPDGTVIFLVDSESPTSKDYSPPGQEYPEASDILRNVFVSNAETTEGPSSDRWGTWESSITPVTDPQTGKVIAVFGMDVDARDWNIRIAMASLPAVSVTLILLFLLFLLLLFSYIQQRNEREKLILEKSHTILRESEHRLNDIINFLPDATFVIDLEGRVITWNKAIEEMTGVGAGEMLGKDNYAYALPFYKERRPILINLVLEPDNETAKKYTRAIHRQGDLLITETETDLDRPDGSHAVLAARASPLRDVEGTIIGAIESIRDITYRKRAERELKISEERLRLLLQNVNDGILVHRVSKEGPGQILDVNDRACQILGYTREELLNMSIKDIVVPEQQDKVGVLTDEIFSKQHILFETEYFKKDRQRVPVEISVRLFEMEGAPTVLAIVRDITERKELEGEMAHYTSELKQYMQTLQQVNDKLNLMNRITRHDILNQLTAIVAYLDLMRQNFPDPKLQEYIGIEIRAARNIQDQILFTKEYQDIGSQSPRLFNLRSVILSAAEKLTLAGITLAVHVDQTEISADPLFEKVIYTLLENSIRHGGEVTDIRFSCRELDSGLIVVYEDNGAGVPAAYKEDIFDQKYFKHTGYGLFLSRTILSITGITIRETGDPGKGARFEILVPKGGYRSQQPL